MSNRVFTRTIPAVLVATVLSSTAAFAAPLAAVPAIGATGAEGHVIPVQMRNGFVGHRPFMGGVDHVEGRIAFLKAELKITDAQATQWDAVATAMRDQSAALKALRDQRPKRDRAERDKTVTAPEALARRDEMLTMQSKVLAARAEGQKQFADAFTKLYAQLSDDQKKTADSLLTRHGRGHR